MRGDGKTTRQMQAAKRGAVYIWHNANCTIPREIAEKIGRKDLRIMPLSALDRPHSYGLFALPVGAQVVIDHACVISQGGYDTIARLRAYRRTVTTEVPAMPEHIKHAANCSISEKLSERCSCGGYDLKENTGKIG
jgi:hypothetical protein